MAAGLCFDGAIRKVAFRLQNVVRRWTRQPACCSASADAISNIDNSIRYLATGRTLRVLPGQSLGANANPAEGGASVDKGHFWGLWICRLSKAGCQRSSTGVGKLETQPETARCGLPFRVLHSRRLPDIVMLGTLNTKRARHVSLALVIPARIRLPTLWLPTAHKAARGSFQAPPAQFADLIKSSSTPFTGRPLARNFLEIGRRQICLKQRLENIFWNFEVSGDRFRQPRHWGMFFFDNCLNGYMPKLNPPTNA